MIAEIGQRIKVTYEDRKFEVIVIDPNGLGQDQPSVGLGFRMMEKYAGLPNETLSRWTKDSAANLNEKDLKSPSGNTFRVLQILADDNNTYSVIEIGDFVNLVVDVVVNPGKLRKTTIEKVAKFLGWFAVKGFYAETYVSLKGYYTKADSESLTWRLLREIGKPRRNLYTDLLKAEGCSKNYHFGNWTNKIYRGLFGMSSKQIKEVWELQEGDKKIARNYIPKQKGLDAVAYCEMMTVAMHRTDLLQAHMEAIAQTIKKFGLGEPVPQRVKRIAFQDCDAFYNDSFFVMITPGCSPVKVLVFYSDRADIINYPFLTITYESKKYGKDNEINHLAEIFRYLLEKKVKNKSAIKISPICEYLKFKNTVKHEEFKPICERALNWWEQMLDEKYFLDNIEM